MTWLLNDSQLEPEVVQPWRPPKRKKAGPQPNCWIRQVTFASALLLGASLYMPGLHTNSPSVELSITGAYGVSSAHDARPPLEQVLAGRFNSEWTPAIEDSLLAALAEEKTNRRDRSTQVTETVFFNQIEYPESDVPRLNRIEIDRIASQKKRS